MTYEQALAAFEAEPPIQVVFEQGAADGALAGAPMGRFSAGFSAWPVPEAVATTLVPRRRRRGARLTASSPTGPDAAPAVDVHRRPGGAAGHVLRRRPAASIWRSDTLYDWQQIPDGLGLTYTTAPLEQDTCVIGSGSADLWISSSAARHRPRGDDQRGARRRHGGLRPDRRLRASQRALDEAASTPTRPVHTQLEADAAPLPTDGPSCRCGSRSSRSPTPFRAGSSLRVTIDAPGQLPAGVDVRHDQRRRAGDRALDRRVPLGDRR